MDTQEKTLKQKLSLDSTGMPPSTYDNSETMVITPLVLKGRRLHVLFMHAVVMTLLIALSQNHCHGNTSIIM